MAQEFSEYPAVSYTSNNGGEYLKEDEKQVTYSNMLNNHHSDSMKFYSLVSDGSQ